MRFLPWFLQKFGFYEADLEQAAAEAERERQRTAEQEAPVEEEAEVEEEAAWAPTQEEEEFTGMSVRRTPRTTRCTKCNALLCPLDRITALLSRHSQTRCARPIGTLHCCMLHRAFVCCIAACCIGPF